MLQTHHKGGGAFGTLRREEAEARAAEVIDRGFDPALKRVVKHRISGAVTGQGLFVRVGVRCCRMFVSLFAMLLSRSRVMLGVLVFPARVVMLGLMMVMRGSVVMSGSVMMMLLRGMLW